MAQIKPSSHGIVVDHKESGTRYAISDRNYDSRVHNKVRDLRADETVLGFKPLRRKPLGEDPVQDNTDPEGSAEADAQA